MVTNGVRRGDAGDTVHITDIHEVAADPLRALHTQNWLLPGSWLCRTDAVPDSVFEGMPRYLECTYLAIRLASVTGLTFIEESTVVYHEDTPCSESKSPSYVLGQEAALRRILELELPPELRRRFKRQLGPASCAAAIVLAERGDLRGAWRRGLRALSYPGGWRRLAPPVTRDAEDFCERSARRRDVRLRPASSSSGSTRRIPRCSNGGRATAPCRRFEHCSSAASSPARTASTAFSSVRRGPHSRPALAPHATAFTTSCNSGREAIPTSESPTDRRAPRPSG